VSRRLQALDRYLSPSFERKIERREREGKGSEVGLILKALVRMIDRQEIQLAVLEMTRSPTYTGRDRGRP
jgi:hypothetical protein